MKQITKYILLQFLLLLSVSLLAQDKISVESFELLPQDLTANIEGTSRFDPNTRKNAALIKIETTQKGFVFEGGSLGFVGDPEYKTGEIWLYVPDGAKKITLKHETLGVLRNHYYGVPIQSGKTYLMKLSTAEVITTSHDYEHMKDIEVTVIPANAQLFINGGVEKLNNGKISKTLSLGTHTYRASALNYHTQSGKFEITDSVQSPKLSIILKPAFGYLNVNGSPETDGGELYIDGQRVGKLPMSQQILKSGKHKVEVFKKLYHTYVEEIEMKDSVTISLMPTLEPNCAEYEFLVVGDNNAQIFDNGELLGAGYWSGKLEAGEHTIEARKISHSPSVKKIVVEKDVNQRVVLSRPEPITGTLEIKTVPSNAKVYIDGSVIESGRTDYINSQLLIGPHRVKLVLPGHKPEEFDVEIEEGKPVRKSLILTDYCDATINSEPNANIYIDGIYMGKTPYKIKNRVAGNYKVEISAHGYTTYSKTLHLDGTTEDMTIKLRRNYVRPSEFYMQVGGNYGGIIGINAGLGGHINNVNMEANFVLGFIESDKIYWTNTIYESIPYVATYKPLGGNFKLGYGFRLHRRIRTTLQVGTQYILLMESVENSYNDNYYSDMKIANGAYTMGLTFGARLNFVLAPWLGLSITPEYILPVYKSPGFEVLSGHSEKIKNYSEGFNCNVGLNIFF
ncbi:MAG: PEGA domain-containing protein [Muribaculaceae bacterium]|nr:PEGA domain-containing protein [Muribaculaceae bacterium]